MIYYSAFERATIKPKTTNTGNKSFYFDVYGHLLIFK